MKKRKIFLGVALAIGAFSLASCNFLGGNNTESSSAPASQESSSQQAASSSQQAASSSQQAASSSQSSSTVSKVLLGINLSGDYATRFAKTQTFSSTGLVVKANYTTGDPETIAEGDYTVTVTDSNDTTVDTTTAFGTAGTYKVTVTFGGKRNSYNIKVTETAEDLVAINYSSDKYGTDNSLTNQNDGISANTVIEDNDGFKMVSGGSKVKYQQVDSNGNSVGKTYNNEEFNSRLQINTGADGAITFTAKYDGIITLYAAGEAGRGISCKNTDTTKSEDDPSDLSFVDKDAVTPLKYVVNAGSYRLLSIGQNSSGKAGGVNIYGIKFEYYMPNVSGAEITDLNFSGQKTDFFEGQAFSTTGLSVSATKGGANIDLSASEYTVQLMKGTTPVDAFTTEGEYTVKVTTTDAQAFSDEYTVNYYLSTKVELKSAYSTVYANVGDTENPDFGLYVQHYYGKIVKDGDNDVNKYLFKSVGENFTFAYYSDEECQTAITAGEEFSSARTIYAKVTYTGTPNGASSTESKLDRKIPVVVNEAGTTVIQFTEKVFDEVTSANGDAVTLTKNTALVEGYLTVGAGSATVKANGEGKGFSSLGVEFSKNGGSNLTITVPTGKVASIKVYLGSTSGSNTTDGITLKNGDVVQAVTVNKDEGSTHTIAVNTDNVITVTGNSGLYFTASNLAEGTYVLSTTNGSRGFRVYSVVITLTNN